MEKILSEETTYEGRRITVKKRRIDLGNGNIVDWEFVDKSDSAAFVVLDKEQNIYLVNEYFGAINRRALCLPKGRIDKGENPEIAAIRECREELGLAGDAKYLMELTLTPGYLNQKTTIFLITNPYPAPLKGDEVQHIEPIKMPLPKAIQLIESGEINEARTVAALVYVRMLFKKC